MQSKSLQSRKERSFFKKKHNIFHLSSDQIKTPVGWVILGTILASYIGIEIGPCRTITRIPINQHVAYCSSLKNPLELPPTIQS